jgi:quinol monooxygenase YgiN
MIVVSGTLEIDPTKRDEALQVAATMAEASSAEPGCVAYAFWADPGEPGRFRIFEEWESEEALGAHFATAHMAEFISALPAVGVKNADVWRYDVATKSKLM